jgi:porin
VIHEWAFKVRPFDLPGSQKVGFVWSSYNFPNQQPKTPFRQTAPLLLKLLGPDVVNRLSPLLPFGEYRDATSIYYNFDQYLYTEPEDETQGVGLFGRFGWATDAIPIKHFYSIGVGGKGVIPERDADTFGVGYYYADLSDGLPNFLHSEQGVECYYNIEITPWLHVTPDLQVITYPGGNGDNDVSLVYGLRLQMNL